MHMIQEKEKLATHDQNLLFKFVAIATYMFCRFNKCVLFIVSFFAYWTPPTEFSEILMKRNMFNDHLPGVLHKAFKELMRINVDV